jgi:hypothetical protein
MSEQYKAIWVRFQKEGIHKYPAALTDPNLADVSFLGYEHRHMFKFKVWIEVFHDDRDLEFIQFKRWLESLYSEGTLQLDYKSCEMISDDLCAQGQLPSSRGRHVTIEVSEDGENGSFAEYPSSNMYWFSVAIKDLTFWGTEGSSWNRFMRWLAEELRPVRTRQTCSECYVQNGDWLWYSA